VASRNLNMFTLIALGVGVAYLYSAVAALAPGLFPASFRSSITREAPVYFEAAGVIATLVLLGQVLELRARSATVRRPQACLGAVRQTNPDRPPRMCPQTLAPARESGQDDCRTGKRKDRLWRTAAPDDPQDRLEDRPPRPLVRPLSQRSRQVLTPAWLRAASAEYCHAVATG